jgi:phage terminase large subunit
MLSLKPKQQLAVEAVNDPTIDTLVLIGTVGTGKTDVAAHIVISICYKFPKTYFPVFRGNLTTAKRSVIPSYEIMLERMGLIEGYDYTFNRTESFIKFANGSIIPFVEADETKDRQGKKIKGINATGNHIDEGDELSVTMYTQANSRRGRRNEKGQPSISIVTLNPTDAEHMVDLYDKFKAGTLPKNIRVIEFTIEDSWQTEQDIAALMTNPKWWVERYVNNNWHFKDEEMTIFKSHLFAKARTDKIEPGRKTMGYDVADEGKDRAGGAEWENLTLYDITVTKDHSEQMKSEPQADWIIRRSDEREIGYENVAVDGVGNGVGVLVAGRNKGADFAVFKSGMSPDMFLTFDDKPLSKADAEKNTEILSFNNLRSQVAYMMAMGMEQGKVKLFTETPLLKEFMSEAQQHHNTVKDKVFILESKESIKKRTGKSPDIFDMVLMGFWKQLKKQAKIDWDEWKAR